MNLLPDDPGPLSGRGRIEAWGSGWAVRPSLWAAADVTLKILGVFLGIALPAVVPALIAGEPILAAGIFVGFQAIGVLPALFAAAAPAVQIGFTTYTADEEGIVVRTQILSRNEKRVPWEKVTAVQQRRTVVDWAFRMQRVDVVAYGQRGATLHLVGLRDAAAVRNEVARRMRRAATVEALLDSD